MKKITAIIIGVLLFTACGDQTKYAPNPEVVFKGKLENPGSKNVAILNEENQPIVVADLDADGNFRIQTTVEEGTYMYFSDRRFRCPIYLKPGDSVYVEANAAKYYEEVKYSGKGKKENKYLAEKQRLQTIYMNRSMFMNEPDAFAQKLNETHDAYMHALNEAYLDNQDFRENERHAIDFLLAITRLNYPHEYEKQRGVAPLLSSNYYDFIKEIDLNDASLLNNNEATVFLYLYANYMPGDTRSEDYPTLLVQQFDFMDAKITNNQIKAEIGDRILSDYLKAKQTEGIQPIVNRLESYGLDAAKLLIYENQLAALKKFEKGNDAFDFTYPDINGKQVSLSDFKGKYVYVDVWATWCGPCKKEIPSLKRLEEEFHGKDIVFMSVSVDENPQKQKWEKFVEDKDLGGVQLFASGWSQIAKDYDITSIPRFMLFDPEGKIVSTNASRPSNPRTTVLLKSLLN